MKNIAKVILLIAASVGGMSPVSAATTHENKNPFKIFTDETRPCTFFQLAGVAQADPAQPDLWFAISHAHPRHAEQFAILLTAKASGQSISVTTNGRTECGFAGVNNVMLG